MKLIIGLIISAVTILLFCSASIGMWGEKVYMVKSPSGDIVCAYVKAVGMTGHKKFLTESEAMKFEDFTVIEYQTEESTEKIIQLSGRKAWASE